MNNPFEPIEEKEISLEDIKIPDCCREGADDCPHGTPKPEKIKINIAV